MRPLLSREIGMYHETFTTKGACINPKWSNAADTTDGNRGVPLLRGRRLSRKAF
jgi:hypothetical protein